MGLSGFLATESKFRPTVHAASRHGTPSLTSLPKDGEVSCEVRPPRSPILSFTSLDRAYLQSPDEDCISHSATHFARSRGLIAPEMRTVTCPFFAYVTPNQAIYHGSRDFITVS